MLNPPIAVITRELQLRCKSATLSMILDDPGYINLLFPRLLAAVKAVRCRDYRGTE